MTIDEQYKVIAESVRISKKETLIKNHENAKDHIISCLDEIYEATGKKVKANLENLADKIISMYPSMYMRDIALFSELAQGAIFGEIFGDLTAFVIMGWLKEYQAIRNRKVTEILKKLRSENI